MGETKVTPAMIAVLLAAALQGAPPPPPVVEHRDELVIYFAPGSSDIRELSRPVVGDTVQQIEFYRPRRILVWAHADTPGPAEANMRLSVQRAQIVRDALVAAGAPADRIALEALGESQPAVATDDKVAEPLNDRVVVILKDLDPRSP